MRKSIIDNREIENMYSLKAGNVAHINLKRGDIYIGVIDYIDYSQSTIVLKDGFKYEVTVAGTVQKYFSEVTIHEEDVLCCTDKSPLIVYVPMDKKE